MNLKKAWKSAPSLPSTAAPTPPPYSPPPYYTPYALPVPMPFGSAGPYGTPAEASNRWKASKPVGFASRPSSSKSMMEPQSSPTDPLTLTRLYIEWYREEFSAQTDLLDVAAERIAHAVYSLNAILELRAEDWQRIRVPEGLGWQLTRNIMKIKWQRDST
jgi:hypothetical protein